MVTIKCNKRALLLSSALVFTPIHAFAADIQVSCGSGIAGDYNGHCNNATGNFISEVGEDGKELSVSAENITLTTPSESRIAIFQVGGTGKKPLNPTLVAKDVTINADFTGVNNTTSRGIVVKTEADDQTLSTILENTTINITNPTPAYGNLVGYLSETISGNNTTHDVQIINSNIMVSGSDKTMAVTIYSQNRTSEAMLKLNGTNTFIAEAPNALASTIEMGNNNNTIIEEKAGSSIVAKGRSARGIYLEAVNKNIASLYADILSESTDGTALGIQSISDESQIALNAGSITVNAQGGAAAGVSASGNGTQEIFSNAIITVDSDGESKGLTAASTSSSSIITSNGDITVTGTDAYGIRSITSGAGAATINSTGNINITAAGGIGRAISAEAGTDSAIVNASGKITLAVGDGSQGIYAISGGTTNTHNASVNFENGTITMVGNAVFGILAKAQNNANAVVNAGNIIVKIDGDEAFGIEGRSEGAGNINVNLSQPATVEVNGINARGVSARQWDSATGDATINLASGVNIKGGSGKYGSAVMLAAHNADSTGKLTLNSAATLESDNDQAVRAIHYGLGDIEINNLAAGKLVGYVTLGNNELSAGTGNVEFNNQGQLALRNRADQLNIINNIGSATQTGTLNNSGQIYFHQDNGNTQTKAEFNVDTFNNSGMIDLTNSHYATRAANSFVGDQITITGNYIANGGSLVLDTQLNNVASNGGLGTSDKLIINGDVNVGAGGATQVIVNGTGLGEKTTGNGIQIIEVNGNVSASGAFALGRPVASGAYEYILVHPDNNWYLSSYDTTSGGLGALLYNPAVGSYLANQSVASEMFKLTLHDRLISSDGDSRDAEKQQFWFRTQVTHNGYYTAHRNINSRNRLYMMQMGGDLSVFKVNGGNLHVGVMAGYGDFENRSKGRITRTKAKGKVKGYDAGLYATWYQTDDTAIGMYIDTWSQMSWFRNEVSGDAMISAKKYNSTNWSNSIELGYGISLGKNGYEWIATPQAQLTYNLYSVKNQHDKNGTIVSNDKANGLETRLGMRLHGRSVTNKQGLQPFLEVNYLHSTAKNQLDFSGKRVTDGLPTDRAEVKLGLQGNVNDNWSVSGQVGGQWGTDHFQQFQGQLQVTYKW